MAAIDQEIVIRSEQDAFAFLQRALDHEVSDLPLTLKFDSWPVLEIRLEGKGYAGTITADMAKGLVELQRAMDRAYARTVHHATNARKLTDEERQELSFKAKVEKGSSLIKVDLGEYAEKLAQSLVDKMTPEQLVMMVVGVAVAAGSVVAYKSFLKARSEDKKVSEDTRRAIALSQEETKRIETFGKAMTAAPALQHLKQDFDEARNEIVRGTSDANTIVVSGVSIDSQSAKVISMGKRSESKEVQLNGSYVIRKTDWQNSREIRLVVANDERGVFSAAFTDDSLDQAQMKLLQAAEWSRGLVYLSINANVLRGEVTKATIIGVAAQPESKAEPGLSDA